MNKIDESIQKFVKVFSENEQNMGEFKLNIKTNNDIFIENMKISKELEFLYLNYDLDNTPVIGGDFYIEFVPIRKIEEIHFGWRWIKVGDKIIEDITWNKNWIIFAMRNEDVLIADVGEEGTPVIGSIQKNNFKISDSLADFLSILTECLILEEKEFNYETRLEDMSYKEEFLKRISDLLLKRLSKENADNFFKFFFE